MFIRSRIILLALIGLGFAFHGALADGLAIRGNVTGTDGKPLAGAELRAERIDGKAPVVMTKTDAKGRYAFKGLMLGAYKVTAIINHVPKSYAAIRTRESNWVRVDFDFAAMSKAAQAKKTKKRYVWVPEETGTHIGGGHWEEVDSNGNTPVGTQPVDTINGHVLQQPQSPLLNPTGGSAGAGH
jgi:Carboxypeptidase regulatory-like domain